MNSKKFGGPDHLLTELKLMSDKLSPEQLKFWFPSAWVKLGVVRKIQNSRNFAIEASYPNSVTAENWHVTVS